jgi:hypothetical protein
MCEVTIFYSPRGEQNHKQRQCLDLSTAAAADILQLLQLYCSCCSYTAAVAAILKLLQLYCSYCSYTAAVAASVMHG